ncbi:hypothetical protein J6590_054672 [Homalodisca vitripennis]|nr:hypothetical protein J6590_054672 [Homalodisca vitripennis]
MVSFVVWCGVPQCCSRTNLIMEWANKAIMEVSGLTLILPRYPTTNYPPVKDKGTRSSLTRQTTRRVVRMGFCHEDIYSIYSMIVTWALHNHKHRVRTVPRLQKPKRRRCNDVTSLTEAIDNVTAVDWENCVRHSENLQSDDWAKEIVRDDIMEPFIINLRDDSSDSENSDSDCDIDKD